MGRATWMAIVAVGVVGVLAFLRVVCNELVLQLKALDLRIAHEREEQRRQTLRAARLAAEEADEAGVQDGEITTVAADSASQAA